MWHWAFKSRTCPAIGYAILAMLLVIIAYDQLLFRPVGGLGRQIPVRAGPPPQAAPESWMLDLFRRTRALAGAVISVRRPEQGVFARIGIFAPAEPIPVGIESKGRALARGSMRSGLRLSSRPPAMPPGRAYQYLSGGR